MNMDDLFEKMSERFFEKLRIDSTNTAEKIAKLLREDPQIKSTAEDLGIPEAAFVGICSTLIVVTSLCRNIGMPEHHAKDITNRMIEFLYKNGEKNGPEND